MNDRGLDKGFVKANEFWESYYPILCFWRDEEMIWIQKNWQDFIKSAFEDLAYQPRFVDVRKINVKLYLPWNRSLRKRV